MNSRAPEAGLASLLASRGRNGDSVLVHMTPSELNGLQQLAFAAGGQLTVNPHTGLYEANFLKKLLPTLLGFGLNFLFPGLGAVGSSLLVGGVETARTGDLSKGLMAGLGAYGGASLGSAVSTVGQEAAKVAGAEATAKALAPEALKAAPVADITKANLQAGMGALRTAPGAALKGVGSQLGAPAVMGLGSTAANIMTPEMKPYDPEDPTFYMSGGYDPYTGFKPGYYSKTYKPFGMAMGGVVPHQNGSYPMGAMQAGARSFLDTNAPREVVGGYDALVDPMTGQERPQTNFAEGGPTSAANVQYTGSDAEKLRQYLQVLNQSFIPQTAPSAPPPSAPPAGVAPPGAGGNFIARDFGGLNLDELRNYGMNLDPATLASINRATGTNRYSKPIYMMTAQEKALEDAARSAANAPAVANVRTDVSNYVPPPATSPFNMDEARSYFEDYFSSQLDPLSQRLAAIEQKPVEQFDYSRIPTIDLNPFEQRFEQLESRLSNLPAPVVNAPTVDLSGLESRLAGLEKGLGSLPSNLPKYEPPDLSELESRLGARFGELESRIGNINIPAYTPPDLSGIEARFGNLESRLSNLPAPDFSGLESRLGGLESRIGNINIPSYTPPDFSGIESRLGGLESRIGNINIPSYTPPDFSGIESRLGGLESRIGNINIPSYTPPDLSGLESRLGGIESRLSGLGSFDYNYNPFGNEYQFGFAEGGVANYVGPSNEVPVGGKLLNGHGDGMSDNIKANINGDQEARLADGEFVIPADVVSHLGNGSTDAGSKKLYDMMARVRKARTGRTQQAPQVDVNPMLPA
jgi:hypothetical protein